MVNHYLLYTSGVTITIKTSEFVPKLLISIF